MSFGLQMVRGDEPKPGSLVEVDMTAKLPVLPWGGSRINKRQLQCRRCHREVEETAQYGEWAGARRIITCLFKCHGEQGAIRICEDQNDGKMVIPVFTEGPELECHQAETPALTDYKPVEAGVKKPAGGPVDIDVEAEVMSTGYRQTPSEAETSTPPPLSTAQPPLLGWSAPDPQP